MRENLSAAGRIYVWQKDYSQNRASAIEYGLLTVLAGLLVTSAATALGSQLNEAFTAIANALQS